MRVCVHDLGGRGSNGRAWPVQQARASIACDDGRWQRRADLGREHCCFICLRRLNLRIPEQCARGGPTATADGDRMHACTRNTDHAPCSMRQARCAANIMQTMRRMALRGTQHHSAAGRGACNKQSYSCNNRRAWRVASAPVRNSILRRDNKVEDQLVPSGATAYLGLCGRAAGTDRAQLRSSACRRQAVRCRHAVH